MKNKTLFNSLIFTFSLIGSCLVIDKPIKADISPSCPDPSSVNISEIGSEDKDLDINADDSFISLTKTSESEKGYCKTTPEQYGIKVFKMGFCEINPGNPNSEGALVGQDPDYSSCSWAFESADGTDAEFTATSSIDLPDANSSKPAAGTYPYAVMIMSNELKIKGKYGPIAGKTYYTKNANVLEEYSGTEEISKYAASISPVTFKGPSNCLAVIEGAPVTGGTMSAYILDDTEKIINAPTPSTDSSVSDGTSGCHKAKKLLGVVTMTNEITIDDNTNGVKMTYGVSDAMNATLYTNVANTDENYGKMYFISKAFSVTFETF